MRELNVDFDLKDVFVRRFKDSILSLRDRLKHADFRMVIFVQTGYHDGGDDAFIVGNHEKTCDLLFAARHAVGELQKLGYKVRILDDDGRALH